jgi:quercetin dioxygenase-like cupin family protein
MPIIDHNDVPEVPWRPDYRKWDLVGSRDGLSTNLSYSIAEVGAGAPLHIHQDVELITILEGNLEVRIGDEVRIVGSDHTLAIPSGVPHGFTVVGEVAAKLLVFFPTADPFAGTTYLEGSPPSGR